jgi:Putative Actinobacterial Holin-X, holin superfamily III
MASEESYGRSTPEQESTPGLFSRLINDANALLRSEIALAKSELSEAATNAQLGLAALAVAFAVLLAGAQTLIAAIILGLAEVMAPWVAALIVGAILAAIGAVMLATAKRKLLNRPIPRTQDSLQQDAALIARRT